MVVFVKENKILIKIGWDSVKKLSMILILCLAATLAGCSGKAAKETSTEEVETQEVSETSSIDVFGEVKVERAREIIIDFPATVAKIHIKDDQKAKKGDPLIALDFNEYEMNIVKKQNEIALYEGQIKNLQQNMNPGSAEVSRLQKELNVKQGYLNSDPDIQALQRSLELVNTEILTAKKEYEVSKELFDIGSISPKELEDAKQKLSLKEKEKKDLQASMEKIKTNREIEVAGLAAALKSSQAQLSNTDIQKATSILELESKLETAKIDLNLMQDKLNKSYIKDQAIIADTDNIIIYDLNCSEGSVIGKGEAPVMRLMDENTLFVSVDIPEEFISQVATGSKADIVPYADKGQAIQGKVIRLADRAIKQNGETIIKADIAVEGDKGILKPGLTVDVKIYK